MNAMFRLNFGLAAAFGSAIVIFATVVCTLQAAEPVAKVPLPLQLPAPTLKGTPEDLPAGPNIEPLSKTPRPPFMVVPGVKNVALGRPITSSMPPGTGELKQITDGRKEASDEDAVEFKKGTLWVQVDLGSAYAIQAIVLWHDHRYLQAMHDVIVQIGNDPEFKTNVTTLFNNDVDDSSGLGVGTDREYFETAEGKIIDARGISARYVRCYTRGSSAGALNCWQEIEVYALPSK